MRSELLASLRAVMRRDFAPKTPVTPETPVTGPSGYRSKPQGLQGLHRLQVKNSKLGNDAYSAVTAPATDLSEGDEADILERAGMCAGSIPPVYLDTWARLNCQKPLLVSDEEWRRALDDGGRFLDAWGNEAALWVWAVAELFDAPRQGERGGLIWFIGGATVEAFGPDHARLSDGRIFDRGTIGGKKP